MPSYISAYDTEAVYAWWDAPAGPGYQGRISYEGERLAECIAGVRAVAQVHLERQAPASFFIVAELLQQRRTRVPRHPRRASFRHPMPLVHPQRPNQFSRCR